MQGSAREVFAYRRSLPNELILNPKDLRMSPDDLQNNRDDLQNNRSDLQNNNSDLSIRPGPSVEAYQSPRASTDGLRSREPMTKGSDRRQAQEQCGMQEVVTVSNRTWPP
jgi:hypothetical protein